MKKLMVVLFMFLAVMQTAGCAVFPQIFGLKTSADGSNAGYSAVVKNTAADTERLPARIPLTQPRLVCTTDGHVVSIKVTGSLSLYRYCADLPRGGKIWLCLVTKRDNWTIFPEQCRAYGDDPSSSYSFNPVVTTDKEPYLFAFRFVYSGVERHLGDISCFETEGRCLPYYDEPAGAISFQIVNQTKALERKR